MPSPSRPPLSDQERLDWLRLLRSENVGPVTFRRLLQRYGSAAAAMKALPELARAGGLRRRIRIASEDEARREMAAHAAIGAELIGLGEPDYPDVLAAADDAPALLAVIGDKRLLRRPAVAVVGARNASANGRRLATQLSRDLGQAGLAIVSGLARGIDAAAHLGALESGTIAVVAGGLDVHYPRENEELQRQIARQGLLMGEMPPGTEPQARHFPRRNRIIAGLSLGILVVEAAPKSGSLITARLANDQGREVFAVPGSPLDPRSRGCNELLRQGATLVESAGDVLDALEPVLRRGLDERRRPATDAGPQATESATEDELEPCRSALSELLGVFPVAVDELIRQCQFSPSAVSTVLLELELAGRLERHPGNRVSLIVGDREG